MSCGTKASASLIYSALSRDCCRHGQLHGTLKRNTEFPMLLVVASRRSIATTGNSLSAATYSSKSSLSFRPFFASSFGLNNSNATIMRKSVTTLAFVPSISYHFSYDLDEQPRRYFSSNANDNQPLANEALIANIIHHRRGQSYERIQVRLIVEHRVRKNAHTTKTATAINGSAANKMNGEAKINGSINGSHAIESDSDGNHLDEDASSDHDDEEETENNTKKPDTNQNIKVVKLVTLKEALEYSLEHGIDLIEVSVKGQDVPIIKAAKLSSPKYQLQTKQRQTQKDFQIEKQVRFKAGIGDSDSQRKIDLAIAYLQKNHRVAVQIRGSNFKVTQDPEIVPKLLADLLQRLENVGKLMGDVEVNPEKTHASFVVVPIAKKKPIK